MNSICPLLNYFIIFRPRLIFQNLESITSFLMHYSPALIMMILRFYNVDETADFKTSEFWDNYASEGGLWRAFYIFLIGFCFYSGWCVLYYTVVLLILKDRISERGYLTLYSYATEDIKDFNSLIFKFGKEKGPLTYIGLHCFMGFIGNIGSIFMFYNRKALLVSLVVYAMFPVWACSNYYFDHFTLDYSSKLEARATRNKEKRINKKRSQSASNIDVTPDSNESKSDEKAKEL